MSNNVHGSRFQPGQLRCVTAAQPHPHLTAFLIPIVLSAEKKRIRVVSCFSYLWKYFPFGADLAAAPEQPSIVWREAGKHKGMERSFLLS